MELKDEMTTVLSRILYSLQDRIRDFKVVMTMTEAPVEGLGVPAFSELFTEKLADVSDEEAATRKRYAEVAMALSKNMRAIWIGENVTGEERGCIMDTVAEVASSAAYIEAAAAVRRPVEPLAHEAAKAIYEEYTRISKISDDVIQEARPFFE